MQETTFTKHRAVSKWLLSPHPDSSSFTQDKRQDVVVLVDYKYLGKYNTFAGTHTDIQSFTQ